ncbi:MAG TPA: adenine deaminase [Ruminococcaceae bacterium]|nr:adenine deaminase [Oscillospiraceae bacterium]
MKPQETIAQCVERKLDRKLRLIRVACGEEPADVVFKNATYLNVFSNDFCHGDIAVSDGLIAGIGSYHGLQEMDVSGQFVSPGFIDAHIHLESSLVSPAEFARAVLRHGTTTVITDPHEIANVMGTDGIRYMLQATEGLPIDVHFMLPSCVPATPMDESGCTLDYQAIDALYDHPRVLGLAEMMNYPGVIQGDPDVIRKILACQAHHKKIDGHAPGLSGAALNAYIAAGVYSDHECSTYQDALEKLQLGQFIMIREGTAAHNLRALLPLLNQQYYSRCMFATDDKHPLDLLQGGHIDYIIREAIACGVDPIIAIKAASHHAARYFLMNNKGAIAPGYLADLVIFDDFRHFQIQQVYKRGRCVFTEGEVLPFDAPAIEPALARRAHETFHLEAVSPQQLAAGELPVIGIVPGELITQNLGRAEAPVPTRDLLKIAVAERHHHTGHIGLGYVKGYGLQRGAVATSVAHDSHNIIAIGAGDDDLALAINRIAQLEGGMVVVENGHILSELPLPVAGLMSDAPLEEVNDRLEQAKAAAHRLGVSPGIDPFMTLSFLSLPVIPALKITTHGVFDVEQWKYL